MRLLAQFTSTRQPCIYQRPVGLHSLPCERRLGALQRPAGNCVMKMNYSEVPQRLNDIINTVTGWINGGTASNVPNIGTQISVPNVLVGRDSTPSIDLVHVCVPSTQNCSISRSGFVHSYVKYPPGYRHRTIVVLQWITRNKEVTDLFFKTAERKIHRS